MAYRRQKIDADGLAVHPELPLIGIELLEDGQGVIRYFTDEVAADAAVQANRVANIRALAGAWSDLDWDEMSDELDRIRHANTPTSPIDDL
jgi:hypothetical protein